MKLDKTLHLLFLLFMVFLISCAQKQDPAPAAKTCSATPAAAAAVESNSRSEAMKLISASTAQTCVGGATSFTGTTHATVGSWSAGNNQMSVTVNGSLCNAGGAYANQPCTSVTICSIATPTQCQTINNVLLDTGSYGLRLFSSAITIPGLVPITNGTDTLAECVQYGDGSSQWGPVKYAYVQLGSEPKVGVPIMVVDSTFGTPPAPCSAAQSYPDISPALSGYNGILGVGLFAQDCGAYCVSNSNSAQYYTCHNDGNCACGATADLNAQVINPVAALPTDNNGVNLSLPSVPSSGAASLDGTLTLGIDTQANNAHGSTTVYAADGYGQFRVKFADFSSTTLSGFIDSGSSILFIPSVCSTLPDCGGGMSGFFCPSTTQSFTAVNAGYTGATSGTVSFSVANANSLFNTGNAVFENMAGSSGTDTTALFDWGLPFFYGKTVYVKISGKTATGFGSGPYWAY